MFGLSILAIIGLAALVFYAYGVVMFWKVTALVTPPKAWWARVLWSLAWPLTAWPLIKQVWKTPPPDPTWI